MRIHVLSDLHLEFGEVRIPRLEADVVVLAGDIHMGREGRRWVRATFPEQPVIYVLGNHEFYRHSLPELTVTLQRETVGSNIHLLERSSVEIGGYRFLGCTLWTDFALNGDANAGMQTAQAVMSDYTLIQNSDQKRPLRPGDTALLHQESRAWLKQELSKTDPAQTVVVTHHAPSSRSEAPHQRGGALSPAFASNLDELIQESRVPLWIHGHTHHNVDYRMGATRILTNQHGYPDQLCAGFKPDLVLEL